VIRALGVVLLLAACGGEPAPDSQLIAVPTRVPDFPFGPEACPAALLEGTLVRHVEAGVAVQGDPLFSPSIVVWPHGYIARDAGATRELLNGSGAVVAREGDFFSAGGGFYPPDDRFVPCGSIEFRAGP
jgi:hypothetical protein